ncbi:phosphatase PAP2 family protein [Aquirufa sp. ROCK2-A2]
MKALNVSLKVYAWGFLFFEILCLSYVFSFSRFDQVRLINSYHSPFADISFQGFTFLAEIYLTVLLLLYLIWKKKSWVFPFVLTYGISTALTQGLKHLIFSDRLRPFAYFKGIDYPWHFVDGVFMNEYNSFPSGHTAAAFFLFFWIANLINNKTWAFFCCFLAIGVAYSRVYLFQHFPVDTALGAFIGFMSAFLVYYFLLFSKKIQ